MQVYFCFPPLAKYLGVFLFGFFCLPEVALASDIPMAYSATWWACGVLGRAGGSARYMGFHAIPTGMLVLEVQCFCCCCCGQDWGHQLHLMTALTVLDLRPIALLVCYGFVSSACFSHLAFVAFRSKVSNFLTSSLSVRAWTRWNWTFCSFSSSVRKLHLWARALRRSTSYLGSLQAWFTHLPIGIFGIIETQYGPSEMLSDPGKISHSSW